MTAAVSKRLLIVDDEPAMHDSYARCFAVQRGAAENALDAMAAELFGDDAPSADAAADDSLSLIHI